MLSFWENSWMNTDTTRITEYAQKVQAEPDELVDYLHQLHMKTVCDAGCGCGAYTAKLAASGFEVCGFDVSAHAVECARKLLDTAGLQAELKTASVCCTGYKENQFDCVLSRDVLDHMSKQDAKMALKEFLRIVRAGGKIIFTVDFPDEEYQREPHTVNDDGDYLFTSGKWQGMLFHPYTEQELPEILPSSADCHIVQQNDGFCVVLTKTEERHEKA